jgi:probable addiction module antidote protein
MAKRSRKYESGLFDRLRDSRYAVEYVNAAAEDSDEAFLLALLDIAEARNGMKGLARDANVNRENLYRILSKAGNPQYSSLLSIIKALHLKLRVEDDEVRHGGSSRALLKRRLTKLPKHRALGKVSPRARSLKSPL